jgi:hypothetical protein
MALDLNNYAISELIREGNYRTAYQALSYAIETISPPSVAASSCTPSASASSHHAVPQSQPQRQQYTWVDCTCALQRSISQDDTLNQHQYTSFLCMKFIWIVVPDTNEMKQEESHSSPCCPPFAWVLWYK